MKEMTIVDQKHTMAKTGEHKEIRLREWKEIVIKIKKDNLCFSVFQKHVQSKIKFIYRRCRGNALNGNHNGNWDI